MAPTPPRRKCRGRRGSRSRDSVRIRPVCGDGDECCVTRGGDGGDGDGDDDDDVDDDDNVEDPAEEEDVT